MAGSTFGHIFTITTWGESHGKALGVVVDGCPAGLPLCEEDIQIFLDRRKPGQSKYTTPRKEGDNVEILSGVFEGKTTGTPISMMVPNTSQISKDYREIAHVYRPGHADYTFDEKFGFRDYRGGGRSSGRETIGRVAAGAIACKLLKELGITFQTYAKSIGPVEAASTTDFEKEYTTFLEECMKQKDSVGGVIECVISGMPTGIGEPVFNKLDANLAKAVMSIGAVKAFEIGDGFLASRTTGFINNDSFVLKDGKIAKMTNHAGGILGGISDGDAIILRAYVKPTPSIFKEQETVNDTPENIKINIKGRHDPIIVPRAIVVVESMAALTIVDLLFENLKSKMDTIKTIYQKNTEN